MHPAFSVIFFTVFSGTGYGLWFWIGLRCMAGPHPSGLGAWAWLAAWCVGFILVTFGLIASTFHLGKPLRAWRAFSQWRTSWLSREGVLALVTMMPAFLTALYLFIHAPLNDSGILRIAGGLLCLFCLLTIYCTAQIYASLKPIPAWTDRLVSPIYILAGLASGGTLCALLIGMQWQPAQLHMLIFFTPILIILGLAKWRYWVRISNTDQRPTLAAAVGMPDRHVTVFERPNTEPNYLNKEMGYVVARKHALKLQKISLALMIIVPLLCFAAVLVLNHNGLLLTGWTPAVYGLGLVSNLAGTLVERWLFFAQAQHMVDRYYAG